MSFTAERWNAHQFISSLRVLELSQVTRDVLFQDHTLEA